MPERVMPGGSERRPAAFVLDFDGSVGELPGAVRVPLEDRQETVRFACRRKRLRELERELAPMLDAGPSPVFLGSGDFHHVSFLLIERLRSLGKRIQVVVLDNHPDNMRYPFGIHCGSWVWHASRLPFVARVHVVGVASPDVEGRSIWENHLAPLRSGKIVYHCIRRDLRYLRLAGVRGCRSYPSAVELLEALPVSLGGAQDPVYLSIDKDVLAEDVVRTNWDQGVFRMEELSAAVRMLQGRILACDVAGEASSYRYRSRFKRFLCGLDRQPEIPAGALDEWKARHREVNLELLSLLSP